MLTMTLAVALAAHPVDVDDWNADRVATHRIGMWTLGGWAVANMGVGAVGFALEQDERLRFLHLGNLIWNTVNLGLAVVGLVNSYRGTDTALDAPALLQGSERTQAVFFLNGAADVVYLTTAALLWQRGTAVGDARLVGLGQSLALQGGFLLAFDLTLGLLNRHLAARLREGLKVTPLGVRGSF